MLAISENGLTLNPSKCHFLRHEIKFWEMIFRKDGVRPDPEKVEDLQYLTHPADKAELVIFLCMMQSKASFIPQEYFINFRRYKLSRFREYLCETLYPQNF